MHINMIPCMLYVGTRVLYCFLHIKHYLLQSWNVYPLCFKKSFSVVMKSGFCFSCPVPAKTAALFNFFALFIVFQSSSTFILQSTLDYHPQIAFPFYGHCNKSLISLFEKAHNLIRHRNTISCFLTCSLWSCGIDQSWTFPGSQCDTSLCIIFHMPSLFVLLFFFLLINVYFVIGALAQTLLLTMM